MCGRMGQRGHTTGPQRCSPGRQRALLRDREARRNATSVPSFPGPLQSQDLNPDSIKFKTQVISQEAKGNVSAPAFSRQVGKQSTSPSRTTAASTTGTEHRAREGPLPPGLLPPEKLQELFRTDESAPWKREADLREPKSPAPSPHHGGDALH